MIFNKKKLIMMLLFSVVLFATISTSWAADIEDNDINNVALDESKSFDEIQTLIDNAQENDTITLNGTYISSGKHIVVNKTITIDGNNAVLDGNNTSRIFEVNQNGCTFININFINGAPIFDECYEDGGAIMFNCDEGYVNNCLFANCSAGQFGGAVYGGSIFNSTFENNQADSGGALAFATVLKSTFKDNMAYPYCGKSLFNCVAYNCIFVDGEEDQWDPSESVVGNYTYIIFAEDATVNVGDEAYIHVKVTDENKTPKANVVVYFEITGYDENFKEYYILVYEAVSNEDGIATFNCSNLTTQGDIIAGSVRVDHNLSNEDSFTLFVNKLSSMILVNDTESVYTKDVNLTATVIDEKGNIVTIGEVYFEISGEEYRADLIDDKFVYEYKNTEDIGLFNINVFFYGNDQVEESSNSFILNVSKLDTPLNVSITGNYYKTVKLDVNVNNSDIDNVPVILNFSNGQIIELDLNKGCASYYVPFNPGTYSVTVYIDSPLYNADPVTKNFTIAKATNALFTPTELVTTYDSGNYFQVKVTMNGEAMVGVKVKVNIYINKQYRSYYLTTDSNGIVKYSTASKLAIGKHKVYVFNNESANVMTAATKSSCITVNKANTTVYAPQVTFKYKTKNYFRVAIKNKATGKIVSGLAIKIRVFTGKSYKTYTVKTNANGIALLSTAALSKGTHKVIIASGNSYYTVSSSGNLIVIK